MAGLPAGYAEEVASEQPLRGYVRWTDGEYLVLIEQVTVRSTVGDGTR